MMGGISRTAGDGARSRALVEVAAITLLFVLLAIVASQVRPVGQLTDSDGTRAAELLLAALLAVPVATTILAHRRHSEASDARRELVHLSLHDPLTGLPNRRRLPEWVAADIVASQERNTQAAVLFVDLDRFQYVNDIHGHEVGDQLMRAVADRLRDLLGESDRLARYGGDEFVVLCPGLTGPAAAEKIARRIIEVLERPFRVGAESVRISANVGIALAEHRGVKPEDVLRDADVAVFQANIDGKGKVVTFDRSMTGMLTPATAEEHIRAALEAGEFRLHYQPVVDLTTGRVVGAEALLRWMSLTRGTMSPSEFIPILEETGLIVPVGTWVLEEACREVTRLRRILGVDVPFTLTVNVSARQIAQADFADVVANALQAAGVGHGQIHLEITEGALMHDVASAWTVLRQAKALGVKLALDDFGTGYSSLSYVRQFSLDMLKIDKSFVDGIETSPEDRAIVQHVVAMATALGMTTVAEGVERPEQLAWLRRLGCRLAQGYVLSRPLSADDLEKLLLKRRDQPFEIDAVSAGPIDLDVPVNLRSPEPPPSTPPPLSWTGPGPSLADVAPVDHGAHLLDVTGSTAPPVGAGPAARSGSPGLPRLREYRPPPGGDPA